MAASISFVGEELEQLRSYLKDSFGSLSFNGTIEESHDVIYALSYITRQVVKMGEVYQSQVTATAASLEQVKTDLVTEHRTTQVQLVDANAKVVEAEAKLNAAVAALNETERVLNERTEDRNYHAQRANVIAQEKQDLARRVDELVVERNGFIGRLDEAMAHLTAAQHDASVHAERAETALRDLETYRVRNATLEAQRKQDQDQIGSMERIVSRQQVEFDGYRLAIKDVYGARVGKRK